MAVPKHLAEYAVLWNKEAEDEIYFRAVLISELKHPAFKFTHEIAQDIHSLDHKGRQILMEYSEKGFSITEQNFMIILKGKFQVRH
jgi:hypothetical protein